jgi:hypothetical protein
MLHWSPKPSEQAQGRPGVHDRLSCPDSEPKITLSRPSTVDVDEWIVVNGLTLIEMWQSLSVELASAICWVNVDIFLQAQFYYLYLNLYERKNDIRVFVPHQN